MSRARRSYLRTITGTHRGEAPLLLPPHVPVWGLRQQAGEELESISGTPHPQATVDFVQPPSRRVDEPVKESRDERTTAEMRPPPKPPDVPSISRPASAQPPPANVAPPKPGAVEPQNRRQAVVTSHWPATVSQPKPARTAPETSSPRPVSRLEPGTERLVPKLSRLNVGEPAHVEPPARATAPAASETAQPRLHAPGAPAPPAQFRQSAPPPNPAKTGEKPANPVRGLAPIAPSNANRPPVAAQPRPSERGNSIHIGSVDVHITAPPVAAPRTAARRAVPVSPLSRGFMTPIGLRQG